MNNKESLTRAYDLAAGDYATRFWNEFDKKPFDQLILNWFAGQIQPGETVLEIGAGPGEVSGYLSQKGVQCIASDRSPQMAVQAKKYFPQVRFEVQDFFNLTYKDQSFAGVAAFYAIVNLQLPEVKNVLQEVKRVLKENGLFLFSFHIYEDGQEEKLEVKQFFDKAGAELTFYLFKADDIKSQVEGLGFKIEDILIRYPYKGVEHPTKRAYFVVRKVGY
jgi:ubiquinone/menaquinone biosynthesis C-methylase UbiE